MSQIDLDAELAALPELAWSDLRRRWGEITGRPVPRVRHALLRMAFAYELQAAVYGRLTSRSQQRLERMPKSGPLTGKIFDAAGEPLLATHTSKPGKGRYRYYVSKALHHRTGESGVRIPACCA